MARSAHADCGQVQHGRMDFILSSSNRAQHHVVVIKVYLAYQITTYIVTDADCDDANDLECDSTCSQSVGWTVTIPGGTELLSGS